jgi:putative hydrolase of the HAD superfamily
MRQKAGALLLDFDGVLRHFDPSVVESVERGHGLPPGAVHESALAWHRLQPVITGEHSHEVWLDGIAYDLGALVGQVRAQSAVAGWRAYRGEVVVEVLTFVREARAAGLPVGLATNATSLLDADLDSLGLTDEFDAVINSSVLGTPKPTGEFFTAACLAVRTPPARCLFVDDDDRNVRGARAAGLSAYRWTSPADLPYLRAALDLG